MNVEDAKSARRVSFDTLARLLSVAMVLTLRAFASVATAGGDSSATWRRLTRNIPRVTRFGNTDGPFFAYHRH